MILFGDKVFAEVINLKWSRLGQSLMQYDCYCYEKRNFRHRHIHRKCHVMMKAELGVMPQKSRSTKDFWQTARSWGKNSTNFCFSSQKGLVLFPLLFTGLAMGSVQFSCSVMSNSLRPHGLQHIRLPCPSPTPGACANSCPLSWWCHQTISSSVVPFCSCLQFFPASGSFPMSQSFTSDGQSIRVSASASVFPMNTQGWFPLGLTGWISCSPRDSQEFSPTPQFKSINSSALRFLYGPTLTSAHGKTIALTRQTFVGKVMSLLFNMLYRLVIAFLPRSKHLLISCLHSPAAGILEPKKIKSFTVSIISPSICHEVMGPDAMIFVFRMLSFKPAFSLFLSLLFPLLFNGLIMRALPYGHL